LADSKQSRVAFVTGAGPGLGASLARRVAKEYAVAINARSESFVRSLADEIRAAGGVALEVPGDVGARDQVAGMFRSIRDRLGRLDVLVYNAGSAAWGTVMDITPEQFEATWRTNTFGAFLCAAECAPDMSSRGHGVMLFTGATAGVKAGLQSIAFGPAKFAMRGLAQSLARDLGPKGIHVAWINVDGSIDIPGARGRKPRLEERRLSQARRHCRDLLASRTSGPERLDDETGSPSVQREVLAPTWGRHGSNKPRWDAASDRGRQKTTGRKNVCQTNRLAYRCARP
jgi:NAD(P)-dependent dehydrogenase (short-subunit alcohol dehydrogenase family)